MRTGWLVILGIVAAAAGLITYFGVHGERVKATAAARRSYLSAVYAEKIADTVASRGSKFLGAARYAKASQDYGQAANKAREAERAYMEACRQCASGLECERDRLVIASGRSTDNYNPCE